MTAAIEPTSDLPLEERFDAAGTDKGCYASIYEVLLHSRRHKIANVLEVGIGTLIRSAPSSMHGYVPEHYRPGASLRVWRDYFPNAQIFGIDIQPDTQFADERITTRICDSTDPAAADQLLSELPQFDLIVDDGSHLSADQLATLHNLFPALAPTGLYVIEDIDNGTALFREPDLVASHISGSAYFAVCGTDKTWGSWKVIVIRKLDAANL